MHALPIMLKLANRPVLVVGGGEAALAKVRLLLDAHAEVSVIAGRDVKVADGLKDLSAQGKINLLLADFDPRRAAGKALIISAAGVDEIDERVSRAAKAENVPVNVVDKPNLSTVTMPALVNRGDVVVGISTNGASPILARRIRGEIERLLPVRLGALAAFAREFRDAVKSTIPEFTRRLRFWEQFFDGPIAEAVLKGKEADAREAMLRAVNRPVDEDTNGAVYIVGAGPGDPELLTVRAHRLLGSADVVVHDRLVSKDILALARRDADFIYVGKQKAKHTKTQDEINALLAEHARSGKRVIRLKGGDPFVYGRGGEEMEHLRRQGVDVHIVPGITAAAGCAAYSGIPLTHRDLALSVTYITGHARDGEPDLDWDKLTQPKQTLVIYMGVSTAPVIAKRLMDHGLTPQTPAAIIERGTTPEEKVVTATLGTLGDMIDQFDISAPSLIIVGDVVRLAHVNHKDRRTDDLAEIADETMKAKLG